MKSACNTVSNTGGFFIADDSMINDDYEWLQNFCAQRAKYRPVFLYFPLKKYTFNYPSIRIWGEHLLKRKYSKLPIIWVDEDTKYFVYLQTSHFLTKTWHFSEK